MISACEKILNHETKERIRKRDKISILFIFSFVFVLITILTLHSVADGGNEVLNLVIGVKMTEEVKNNPFLSAEYTAIAFILPLFSFYLHNCHWFLINYYSLVQYCLNEFTDDSFRFVTQSEKIPRITIMNIGEKVENLKKDFFEELMIRIKFYNDLVFDVNEAIGCHPILGPCSRFYIYHDSD